MDYTARAGGQSSDDGAPTANQMPTLPMSSARTRPYQVASGGGGTNVVHTVAGAHIVLFERDQQLAALMTSEIQLAGFTCHAARTAVEVFDTIARQPVQLVLVNLAQAAAARREFWVALDTQRKGRSIQVLTFHCFNIASYGPSTDENDERTHSVIADLEIEGMLGIINMVNAVRARLALSNTLASPRPATTNSRQIATEAHPTAAQITTPLQSINAVGVPPAVAVQNTAAQAQPFRASATIPQTPMPDLSNKILELPRSSGQPNSTASTSVDQQASSTQTTRPAAPRIEQIDGGQGQQGRSQAVTPKESSLAQLSRMLQERRASFGSQEPQPANGANTSDWTAHMSEDTLLQPRVRPSDVTPISAIPLRASPIQDLPESRSPVAGEQHIVEPLSLYTGRHSDEAADNPTQAPPPTTLASISMSASQNPPMPPAQERQPRPPVRSNDPEDTQSLQTVMPPAVPRQSPGSDSQEIGASMLYQQQQPSSTPPPDDRKREQSAMQIGREHLPPNNMVQFLHEEHAIETTPADQTALAPVSSATALNGQTQAVTQTPAPVDRAQALQGRTGRSLTSVLIDGHIVPQNRLEVAQNIQRLLRGVDLNYQLGDILLMFKLLTPDQLLAANLVSLGLISTAQIGALGRIRQELHAIGFQYDLESLLVLFRMLTPEQLREARISWPG